MWSVLVKGVAEVGASVLRGVPSARRVALVLAATCVLALGGTAGPAAANPLDPPTTVTAKASTGPVVTLTWSWVYAVDGYRISRSVTAGGPYEHVADVTTETSYRDDTVAPVTRYYYVVQAIDDGRVSKLSPEATATTGPATPKNPRVTAASPSRVELAWDRAGGAVRYDIFDVGPARDQEVLRGSTTSTTFADTLVSDDSWYYYKVRAVAASGATEDSQVLPVHTGAPTRTTLTMSPTEVGQPLLITATVDFPAGQATGAGQVDFFIDGGLAGWEDSLNARSGAQLSVPGLSAGEHVVYAHYRGYGGYGFNVASSSSALTVKMVKPAYGQVNYGDAYLYDVGSGEYAASVAVADVTGDGLADVLATTNQDNGPDARDYRLYPFVQQPQPAEFLMAKPPRATHGDWWSYMRLSVGDVDRDGDQDVAVGMRRGVDVFRQSNGRLTRPTLVVTGVTGDVRLADMNGDRRADLVVNAGQISVYPSLKGGGFGNPTPVATIQSKGVEVGDVDMDGDRDVVTWAWGKFQVYRQTANHNYRLWLRRTLISGTINSPLAMAIGDVTGDGRNDIVATISGNVPDSRVAVYRGTTTGLAAPIEYVALDIPSGVVLADINCDHLKDVVTSHDQWPEIAVMLQRPDGTLGRNQRRIFSFHKVKADHRALAVGDLNADHHPDIAVLTNYGLVVAPTY